jgi:hypothetical protein
MDWMQPLTYSPNSTVGKLMNAGYVRFYDSIIGSKVKQVNLLFQSVNLGFRAHLPFDPELDNSIIKGIQVLDANESVNNGRYAAPSGDLYPNISAAQMADLFFVLGRNDEQLCLLPVRSLLASENNGKVQLFNSKNHVWADSYVEVARTGSLSVNAVLSLMVYYE